MNQLTTFTGGCHCQKVRYQIQVERLEATLCNCSICCKKGFIHVIVPAARFILLQGQDALSTYTFNTGTAKHHFCRHCGIHSFYRPRSHPDGYDVNLRCLDDAPIDRFQITSFDGAHWEDQIEQIRDLYS
ncbi:GFA family protein [Chamaesiphon sp.]|uniref:GFA family protein n=1 Tax=Chamaesiphon sp. TaxID=2814140 RepID=UPI0035937F1F